MLQRYKKFEPGLQWKRPSMHTITRCRTTSTGIRASTRAWPTTFPRYTTQRRGPIIPVSCPVYRPLRSGRIRIHGLRNPAASLFTSHRNKLTLATIPG